MGSDSLEWLFGLERFGIKLGLDAMRALLDAMRHPERAFPSVLIGGTNGKGSVAATMDAVLSVAGIRTGLYTSPHLVRPEERVRVGGADIGSEELCLHLEAVRAAIDAGLSRGTLGFHPSFFEVMTAAALRAFREEAVQVALLEVGLGGRLDATNVVESILSVVVTVDLDHTDRLGGTIEEIALEKAGIAKRDRVLVSGVVQAGAAGTLRRVCEERGAALVEAASVSRIVEEEGGSFSVETEAARYPLLRLALPGRHQWENTRVAIVALEILSRGLGWRLTPEAVREGVARVRWPGRLQWIDGSPPLLVDGAHNPAGAEALAGYLRTRGGPRPVLLFAAIKEKSAGAILEALKDHVGQVVFTRPRIDRAADPADLARIVPALASRSEVVPQVADALARARHLAGEGSFVLVAGSLYLVGEVLALHEGVDSRGPVAM